MLIKIITVGSIKDKNIAAKTAEYEKRLAAFAKIEIVELKDGDKDKECTRINDALAKEKGYIIVLSEDGKNIASHQFSETIAGIDRKIVFVIGGPYGLSDAVKQRADLLLSLSKMTFTHELARLLLTEQIYRAVAIMRGIKYHND